MRMSETALALERMTDAGKFEVLAMAVLRRAKPEYRGLIHPGRNSEGKTVRSPVDGVYRVPDSVPPHYVIVQHTTCKRSDLRAKWLSKSEHAEGDVVKAQRWAVKERQREPETRVTLVLTSNKIPPDDLVTDVGHACARGGIREDIWDLSLLQDFLDIDRDGQWIRKDFLGIEQERLSVDLLRSLSERSCAGYLGRALFGSSEEEWVPRSLDTELQEFVFQGPSGGVTFLVSGSGFGKSTSTYRLFREHLEGGGFGLWLEPEVVRQAPTAEAAIEATLQSLHPGIEAGCGAVAVDLVREQGGLLLVVDDVNMAPSPVQLVQKIASWKGSDGEKEGYRILCPTWPQVIGQISDSAEKAVRSRCFFAGPFSQEEGATALQRHAQISGLAMTDLEAMELSERLGHDPLLISFWSKTRDASEGAGTPISVQVIEKFVRRRLEDLSASSPGAGLSEDYETALQALARRMLEERTMEPSWQQVSNWFLNSEQIRQFRNLTSQREIIRLEGEGPKRKLAFRHDRLRDHLLARALQEWMSAGEVPHSVLAETYYAEVLGQALLLGEVDPGWALRVAATNPLALFYAFRIFRQPATSMEQAIAKAMREWICDELIPGNCIQPLRWAVDWLLAEIDSPLVLELTEEFTYHSNPLLQARTRNGDVEAAAEYTAWSGGPDFQSFRQDRLIRHSLARFGKSFVTDLAALLGRADASEELRIGALSLAGYLADPELESAIDRCWNHGEISSSRLLTAFLWAGMRCCKDPAPLLDSMFALWSTILEKSSTDENISDLMDATSHNLVSAIDRMGLKDEIIRPLILRAKDGVLAWPIFIILRRLDHPGALEFCLRDSRGWDLNQYWHPGTFGSKKIVRARDSLRRIWEEEAEDGRARRGAFELWASSTGAEAIETLRAINPASILYEQALRIRMKFGDLSCALEVVSKLEESPSSWWFDCYRVWSAPIREALECYFVRRGQKNVGIGWDYKETHEDWIISRLLSQIPLMEADRLLSKHWPHLRFSRRFIQSALYVGTQRVLDLIAAAISDCPNPRRLFKYFNQGEFAQLGSGSADRPVGLSAAHLERLGPYVHLLDKEGLEWLASACNRGTHFLWRRKYVDPLLSSGSRKRLGLQDEDLFRALDDFAAKKRSRGSLAYWLREFPERGDPEERAMSVVAAWLRTQGTFSALEVAAECVALGGTRRDLSLLEASGLSSEDPQVARLLEETRFRVCRRSLT